MMNIGRKRSWDDDPEMQGKGVGARMRVIDQRRKTKVLGIAIAAVVVLVIAGVGIGIAVSNNIQEQQRHEQNMSTEGKYHVDIPADIIQEAGYDTGDRFDDLCDRVAYLAGAEEVPGKVQNNGAATFYLTEQQLATFQLKCGYNVLDGLKGDAYDYDVQGKEVKYYDDQGNEMTEDEYKKWAEEAAKNEPAPEPAPEHEGDGGAEQPQGEEGEGQAAEDGDAQQDAQQ